MSVTMIGFLPGQQQVLIKRFPDISFRFIETERKKFQLPKCSLIVIWVRFINHRLSAAVLKQANCPVNIHRGGMSSIIQHLENWMQGQ